MNKIANDTILKYAIIGVLAWFSIDAFSTIINQISTFIFVLLGLKITAIFYASQLSILLSVVFFAWFMAGIIYKRRADIKSLFINVVVIFIIVELLKFASYFTTPLLIATTIPSTNNYFVELQNNWLFHGIEIVIKYVKPLIVGFTWFYYKSERFKQNKHGLI